MCEVTVTFDHQNLIRSLSSRWRFSHFWRTIPWRRAGDIELTDWSIQPLSSITLLPLLVSSLMSFSETRTFPWRWTPDLLATSSCCIKFRTSQLFLLFFFCADGPRRQHEELFRSWRIQSRDINRSSVSIRSFPLCSGLPGLRNRAGCTFFQTILINPHQRFARHYAPARHYVNVFPLKLLVARILDSAECFLRGWVDVRLRAGRLFCFLAI